MRKELRTWLFAWWYFAIAAGFFLLGLNRWVIGGAWWQIVLRWGIAAGFFLLGLGTLKSRAE